MAIIKQGEPLPPFDSLSEAERQRLHQQVDGILLSDVRDLSAEIVPVRSIGNQGDARSYDPAMFIVPPEHVEISTQAAGELATKIINEVKGIGRVLLDITPRKNGSGSL